MMVPFMMVPIIMVPFIDGAFKQQLLPLVVEFSKQNYFKIWSLVIKYIEVLVIWRAGSTIFKPELLFWKLSLHMEVYKTLEGVCDP